MTDNLSRNELKANASSSKPLKFLGRSQIKMIDEALDAVGPYGEVQLIVEKGRLRFVVTKNSHDALRWHPGDIEDEAN
ncbi:MAG: hypothetical protein ACC700_18010 [Anaerolineales bacterium]